MSKEELCTHTPSSRKTTLGVFVDFLVRRNAIISANTDTACCMICGKRIQPTKEPYSKRWLLGYAVATTLSGILYGLLMLFFIRKHPQYATGYALVALDLHLITMWVVDRVAKGIVFTMSRWETAEWTVETPFYPVESSENAHKAEERHIAKKKVYQDVVLICGSSIIVLLFCLWG